MKQGVREDEFSASPGAGQAARSAGEGGLRLAQRQLTRPSPAAFGVDLSRKR